MHARLVPHEFYLKAFAEAAGGMGLVGMDGKWITVNASLCSLLGYSEAELVTMSWRELTHPDDIGAEFALAKTLFEGKASSYSIRKRCLRPDQSTVDVLVHVTMSRSDETASTFFIVQLLDLPRTIEEEAERRQRERIRLLVENVSDAFIGMDEDGYITEWNRQAERILQWRADEVVGREMAPLLVPLRFRERHHLGMQRFLRTGQATIINKPVELPLLRKDGAEIQTEMTIGAARHLGRYHFATFVRDISERKDLERQLHRQARHDHLTGLPNRLEFMRRLDQQIAALDQHSGEGALALMFIDLDGFKQVNDLLGHQEGDRVLLAFAAALAGCVRPTDVAARLAGDEFVICLPGLDDADNVAAAVARRVLAAARAASGAAAPVSASIGIAVHARGLTADQLVRQADVAMYTAKQGGKNQFAFYRAQGQSLA